MMQTKFIKQKIKRNVKWMLVAILIAFSFSNCKKEDKNVGFTLQRFDVVNAQLDSIIQGIKDSTCIKDGIRDQETVMMVLKIYNSNLEFCFTSAEQGDISEMYIFQNNRRIVGYVQTKDFPLIVLAEISSGYEFTKTFYPFMIPTEEKKQFDYIYFPDDLYCVDNEIPCPPSLFDPIYYCYTFKDGQFIFMNYAGENCQFLS